MTGWGADWEGPFTSRTLAALTQVSVLVRNHGVGVRAALCLPGARSKEQEAGKRAAPGGYLTSGGLAQQR